MSTQKMNINVSLIVIALLFLLCMAIAAPNFAHHKSHKHAIDMSAHKVVEAKNHAGKWLQGEATLFIGKEIKITADKIFVKYKNKSSRKASEYIIFGKGILTDKKHTLKFINGIYDPVTAQLTAEEITQSK